MPALTLTQPVPFDQAVSRLAEKTPVASKLSSAEWRDMAVGLSDRAFFSAKVDDIRTVVSMQSKIQEALDLSSRDAGRAFMDKNNFIASMRAELGAVPGDSGDLQDLTSSRRLGLVYDFQVEDATEAGRHLVGQDPELLYAFPAKELIRLEARLEPREWTQIWQDAGGTVYPGDRLIARKDDPIWVAISDFGRPWAPYKFGSGMGDEDVDREEAIALNVISENDEVQPTLVDFNKDLSAKIPDASPATLEGFKQIFGDQVDVGRDGKIAWQGDRIAGLFREAIADASSKRSLDLGEASGTAVAKAQAIGIDLAESRLQLAAEDVRQLPVTARDLKLVPHVWRAPDAVLPGVEPGSLSFRKAVGRDIVVVGYKRPNASAAWGVHSLAIFAPRTA